FRSQQITQLNYNRDDTLRSVAYGNGAVPTYNVSLAYDTSYERLISMTDGAGSTLYSYIPITDPPVMGAGRLGSIDGPLENDTMTRSEEHTSELQSRFELV